MRAAEESVDLWPMPFSAKQLPLECLWPLTADVPVTHCREIPTCLTPGVFSGYHQPFLASPAKDITSPGHHQPWASPALFGYHQPCMFWVTPTLGVTSLGHHQPRASPALGVTSPVCFWVSPTLGKINPGSHQPCLLQGITNPLGVTNPACSRG